MVKEPTVAFAGPLCSFVTYVLSFHTQKKAGSSIAVPIWPIFNPDAGN
jgi:hypothetical protein